MESILLNGKNSNQNDKFHSDEEDGDEGIIVKNVENEELNSILCPSFTNYLYFLFAPTLIYSDNYPRF